MKFNCLVLQQVLQPLLRSTIGEGGAVPKAEELSDGSDMSLPHTNAVVLTLPPSGLVLLQIQGRDLGEEGCVLTTLVNDFSPCW